MYHVPFLQKTYQNSCQQDFSHTFIIYTYLVQTDRQTRAWIKSFTKCKGYYDL